MHPCPRNQNLTGVIGAIICMCEVDCSFIALVHETMAKVILTHSYNQAVQVQGSRHFWLIYMG